MKINAKTLAEAIVKAQAAGVDIADAKALEVYMQTHAKDTLTGNYSTEGMMYRNGPFSFITDDIFSSVMNGGSEVVQWLPTRLVTSRFERVSHLEFVAPKGFDGSQSYRDWLATITIADCDYGPTSSWSGFEYQMEGGEWSFQSPILKVRDFGQRDFDQSPVYNVRGDRTGAVDISTDADWAVAQALILMQQHVNYVYVYGDRHNSDMETDGLDVLIQAGFVQSRRVGPGIPHFANPLVINGSVLQTASEVLTVIRAMVRRFRSRAAQRGWAIADGDMAVVMPEAMWVYIAEELSRNGGYQGLALPTPRDFLEQKDRILNAQQIDVDGRPVTVLLDGTMGQNVTLNPNTGAESSAVAGDIFVLTRRAGGVNLLETQFLDWRQFDSPDDTSKFSLMGGIVRAGWKNLNEKCFQYFAEMAGRMVTRYQPLQGRINNVVIQTLLHNENEAMSYTAQDFQMYDGRRGGQGNALLTAY